MGLAGVETVDALQECFDSMLHIWDRQQGLF